MQEINLPENREEREDTENMPNDGKPAKRNRKPLKNKEETVEVEGIAFERASNTFRERRKKFGAEEKVSGNARKIVKTLERKSRKNDRPFSDGSKPAKSRGRGQGRDSRSFSDGSKPVKLRERRSAGISGKREKISELDGKDFKSAKRLVKKGDRTFKRAERPDSRKVAADGKVIGLSSGKGERFSKGSARSRKGSAPSKPFDRKTKPSGSFKPASKARGKKAPVIVYGNPKAKPPKKLNRRSIPKGKKSF